MNSLPLTPPCVPFGTRWFNNLSAVPCICRIYHHIRKMQGIRLLIPSFLRFENLALTFFHCFQYICRILRFIHSFRHLSICSSDLACFRLISSRILFLNLLMLLLCKRIPVFFPALYNENPRNFNFSGLLTLVRCIPN